MGTDRTEPTKTEGQMVGSKPDTLRFWGIFWPLVAVVVAISLASPPLLSRWGLRGDRRGGWLPDPEESVLLSNHCDFDRIDVGQLSQGDFNSIYRHRRPVVVTGIIMDDWPARTAWTKDSLRAQYGTRSLKTGSGGDIVNSGGGMGLASSTVDEFLQGLNESRDDAFTFDTAFRDALPELADDFSTPDLFKAFNSKSSRDRGGSWHMLSIGGSRQGLPFHVHGETWLGLVFGYKQWFIYPPGKGFTNATAESQHPLLDVWHWYTHVLPSLKGPERPLACLQRPGEVLYLPSGWKHLTLNIGEAIAVGGQATYPARLRLADSLKVLKSNPRDYEALFGAGLSLAHRITDEKLPQDVKKRFFNQAFNYFKRAMVVRPCQPDAYLLAAELLLGMETKDTYAQAKAIIHEAESFFSDEPGAQCALPAYVESHSRLAALAQVRLKLARFFMQADDVAEAERALKAALELRTSAPALADLTHVLAFAGKKEEAREVMEQALEMAPRDLLMRERFTYLRDITKLDT